MAPLSTGHNRQVEVRRGGVEGRGVKQCRRNWTIADRRRRSDSAGCTLHSSLNISRHQLFSLAAVMQRRVDTRNRRSFFYSRAFSRRISPAGRRRYIDPTSIVTPTRAKPLQFAIAPHFTSRVELVKRKFKHGIATCLLHFSRPPVAQEMGWEERPPAESPILCRVGRKTLTQSINQSTLSSPFIKFIRHLRCEFLTYKPVTHLEFLRPSVTFKCCPSLKSVH